MPFICTLSNKHISICKKSFSCSSFIKRNFEIKNEKKNNMKCKDPLGTWGKGYAVYLLEIRDK